MVESSEQATVIKWATTYGLQQFEEFETLDDAAQAADWSSDQGTESLDGIEVVNGDGSRVYTPGEVWAMAEATRPEPPPRRPVVATVSVLSPDTLGKRWVKLGYTDDASARTDYDRLVAALGVDRVKLESP